MNITFEEIKNIWKKNTFPISLYIHSPFCGSECKYCVYRGTALEKDDFNKFYQEYLIDRYNDYEDIINISQIKSIYFGGGTSNLGGTISHLIPILEKTKYLKCKEKIIELHTGFPITEETINILKKYNFTTVILCQQTFNENILKEMHRINFSKNNLKYIIDELHKKNILVGLDMMVFPEKDPNLIFLENDLAFLEQNKIYPDEITFAPNYLTKGNVKNILDKILQSSYIYNGYIKANMQRKYEEYDDAINCLRFFNIKGLNAYIDQHFYSFRDNLEENISDNNPYTSTIGIGSYKNKDKWVYSKIGQFCIYHEINDDLTKKPYYEATFKTSFWEQLKDFCDFMIKNDKMIPPIDSCFLCKENFPICNNSFNPEKIHRLNSSEIPELIFSLNNCSPEYLDYFKKLIQKY